jgi:hypothetical protein
MKRIEEPPLVIYLDRDLGASLLCFWVFCLILPAAWALWIRPVLAAVAGLGALALVGAMFLLLFRARVIAIDRDMGELRILERTVPWRTRRTQIPLHHVSIWLMRCEGGRAGIFIGQGTHPSILVQRGASAGPLRRLAERLASDLGRPLHDGPWTA